MRKVQITAREKPDWLLPRRVLCGLFWAGLLLTLTGIILLIIGQHHDIAFLRSGGVLLGVGCTFLVLSLILCGHAFYTLTKEDRYKRRVPLFRDLPPRSANSMASRPPAKPPRLENGDGHAIKRTPDRDSCDSQPVYQTVMEKDRRTPNGYTPSDNGTVFRPRAGSTGSKTVTFTEPVITAQYPPGGGTPAPNGSAQAQEKQNHVEGDDGDETEHEPPTPPFPIYYTAGGFPVDGGYGLPYNPNVLSAVSEYDLAYADYSSDSPEQYDLHQEALVDIPLRQQRAGPEFRDDMYRFSTPVEVYLRGQNFGLSQVSLYDNVRYFRNLKDEDDDEDDDNKT